MPILKKSDLKKLRKSLPNDGIKRIMKEFDMSDSNIYAILRGDTENLKVIEFASDLAKEHGEELSNKRSIIKQKISELS